MSSPVECSTCFALVEANKLTEHHQWHTTVDGWIREREIDREQERWAAMGEDL